MLDGLPCAMLGAAQGDGDTPEDLWETGQGALTRAVPSRARHTHEVGWSMAYVVTCEDLLTRVQQLAPMMRAPTARGEQER